MSRVRRLAGQVNRIVRSLLKGLKPRLSYNRFAAWYYVISSDSFEKVRLGRSDLIKEKETMAL